MPTTKSEDELIAEHLEAIKLLPQRKTEKERRELEKEDREIVKAVRAMGLEALLSGIDKAQQLQVKQAGSPADQCRVLMTLCRDETGGSSSVPATVT